jgi:hypothetical protein
LCVTIRNSIYVEGGEILKKLWKDMDEIERNEIIAEKVLGWVKENNQWFKPSQNGLNEGPMKMLSFSSNDLCALTLLQQFNTYQITKMFPTKYRTIINANKNSAIAPTLSESICLAALKLSEVEF